MHSKSKSTLSVEAPNEQPLETTPLLSQTRVCRNSFSCSDLSRSASSDSRSAPSDTKCGKSNVDDYTSESPCCENASAAWDSLRSTLMPPTPKPVSRISLGITLNLENSGSVARDHLASERTFLAYTRTSLAIASSGVALVQLFNVASSSAPHNLSTSAHNLHTFARPLGAGAVVLGLVVLIIGVMRYFTVQAALTKGVFPVARVVPAAMAAALSVFVTVTFGILVAGKLEARGRH
ncbi:hypothetical protein BD779DRAFT_1498680 [Infundibulicybe gibba]|nr:hypothetical protein BD779DRAFT_1498680 [Infundibulicybe gibba]